MLPSLVQLLTDDSAACKVFARLADCRRAWYASFCCAESRYAQVSTQVSTCVAASAMKARGMEGRRPCQLSSLTRRCTHTAHLHHMCTHGTHAHASSRLM